MSRVLVKAAGFFVAPPEPGAFAPPRPRAAIAAVLAAESDLLVAAGAVAGTLRREARSAAALVCVWRGHEASPQAAPALGAPGAARLASKLERRDLEARACGTLCVVELPLTPEAASAAWRDAVAAADAPAVLAVPRREPALDPLLAGADRLVLALADDADPVLAELALAGLARLSPRPERLALPAGLLARQAARLGLARSRDSALTGGPAGALQESLS